MQTKLNLQHIIFSPKYRRNVLTYKVADECYYTIKDICRKHGITCHEIAVQGDHIHIFVEVPHTMPVCKAVQLIKQQSSFKLRRIFPFLKRNVSEKSLWQINYFARSVGGDARTVKRYIQNQMHNIEGKASCKQKSQH